VVAIPMVLELSLESVFAVVDVCFVARRGADAVATVGLTESMLTIIYAAAIGLSVGAMATVARRIGEKNPDGAARAAVQAIGLGVIVSIPSGIAGALLAPRLLTLMGAGSGVLANSSYTSIMLGMNGVILMLFLINAVFRGSGDAAIAMRVLWVANAINICLDPCLIFGLGPFPRLGVTGASVATTTGRGIGVLLQLYSLSRGQGRVAIRREHLRFDPHVMLGMVRLSVSAVVQALVNTTFYNMLFLAFVGIVFIVFAPRLVNAFTDDPEVALYGVRCLRVVSSGFLFYAYGIVLTQSFNGAGDTLTPTLLNLLCFWSFEIPFAYILARVLHFGPQGAFLAIAIAFSMLAVLSAVIFRRGRWKLKRV